MALHIYFFSLVFLSTKRHKKKIRPKDICNTETNTHRIVRTILFFGISSAFRIKFDWRWAIRSALSHGRTGTCSPVFLFLFTKWFMIFRFGHKLSYLVLWVSLGSLPRPGYPEHPYGWGRESIEIWYGIHLTSNDLCVRWNVKIGAP